jgi:hypothetical protein
MELTGWQPESFEEEQPSELGEVPDVTEIDAIYRAWEEDRI